MLTPLHPVSGLAMSEIDIDHVWAARFADIYVHRGNSDVRAQSAPRGSRACFSVMPYVTACKAATTTVHIEFAYTVHVTKLHRNKAWAEGRGLLSAQMSIPQTFCQHALSSLQILQHICPIFHTVLGSLCCISPIEEISNSLQHDSLDAAIHIIS